MMFSACAFGFPGYTLVQHSKSSASITAQSIHADTTSTEIYSSLRPSQPLLHDPLDLSPHLRLRRLNLRLRGDVSLPSLQSWPITSREGSISRWNSGRPCQVSDCETMSICLLFPSKRQPFRQASCNTTRFSKRLAASFRPDPLTQPSQKLQRLSQAW